MNLRELLVKDLINCLVLRIKGANNFCCKKCEDCKSSLTFFPTKKWQSFVMKFVEKMSCFTIKPTILLSFEQMQGLQYTLYLHGCYFGSK